MKAKGNGNISTTWKIQVILMIHKSQIPMIKGNELINEPCAIAKLVERRAYFKLLYAVGKVIIYEF